MERARTGKGGFEIEGVRGDYSGSMCVFLCAVRFGRLASVGLPAKTHNAAQRGIPDVAADAGRLWVCVSLLKVLKVLKTAESAGAGQAFGIHFFSKSSVVGPLGLFCLAWARRGRSQ